MDERLSKIEEQKQAALNQSNNTYQGLLTDNESLYKQQQDFANQQEELTHSRTGKDIAETQEGQEKDEDQKGKENQEENEETHGKEVESEEKQKEEIANKKGIPSHSILFIRENSNFYKDHPQLEPNLYFYRDNNGVIKAEYLDKDGKPQPSKFFEDSRNSFKTRNC